MKSSFLSASTFFCILGSLPLVSFDISLPAELSVQVHAQVFSSVSIWYLLTVNSNWDVFKASVGKGNMNRFRFIKLDVPFFVPFLYLVYGCL